jgi:Caspase domain
VRFALLALSLLAQSAHAETWLFALGTNRGIEGDETLRYAGTDAARVSEVLREVGGLEPSRQKVLTATDAAEARAELEAFGKRLKAQAKPDDRLVLYVSSHADDEALHLTGTTLPLAELYRFLKDAPVSVGLLVLDACRSGAATRLKGLKPVDRAPARVEVAKMEGRVVLSSAAEDEYAQESEALGGGVFTHHLLAALRGAADGNRDGKVTLEEAYLYAHARTLESTLGSKGGAQRPAWSVELRGQGELVLSEPGRAAGQLKLAVSAPGRWLVVNDGSNTVVAEVEKGQGEATLALPPGKYRVAVRATAGWLERRVTVPESGGAVVRGEDLEQASLVQLARKGGERPVMVLSAAGAIASPLVRGPVLQIGGELRLRREGDLLGPINFVAFRVALRDGRSTGLVPFQQTEIEPRLGAGHVFSDGRWRLSLALELGAVLVLQSDLPDSSHRFGAEPTAVIAAEGSVKLVGPVGLFVDLGFGGALLKKDAGVTAVPRGLGALGLRVDL